MRFDEIQREAFREEIERIVFVQAGLTNADGVVPYGKVRKAMANRLMIDLTTAVENIITNGVREK